MGSEEPAGGDLQRIIAAGGFAFGVQGGDLYVPDTPAEPVLLGAWSSSDDIGLPGMAAEQRVDLGRWFGGPARLAVRWLHGDFPGPLIQACACATEASAAGWLVVVPVRGRDGDVPAGPAGAGVLAVVRAAEDWPLRALSTVLSNALLHHPAVPARVLLVGSTLRPWPRVRGVVADLGAAVQACHVL
jgi:hypothetical protein